MSPILSLESVSKSFGETAAVVDLSLTIAAGEVLTLLGPSGCGKTTTLRMIAGFERPTKGRILLEGHDITELPPQRRGFGMVFQNYALFPHLDVAENIAFGLQGRGLTKAELAERVADALALVDLTGYESRKVQELSGGQQQRVALARALAPEPRLILLDEPLSNLDAALRERTRTELRGLVERLGVTAIFVTHDQEEAFDLSDRIAILEGGRLQQVGTPEKLYAEPANQFVATFLGHANFLDAEVVGIDDDGTPVCTVGEGIHWRTRMVSAPTPEPLTIGSQVELLVRPEELELSPVAANSEGLEEPALVGRVTRRRFAGAHAQYSIESEGRLLRVRGEADTAREGDEVTIRPRLGVRPLLTSVAPQKVRPSPIATVGL